MSADALCAPADCPGPQQSLCCAEEHTWSLSDALLATHSTCPDSPGALVHPHPITQPQGRPAGPYLVLASLWAFVLR